MPKTRSKTAQEAAARASLVSKSLTEETSTDTTSTRVEEVGGETVVDPSVARERERFAQRERDLLLRLEFAEARADRVERAERERVDRSRQVSPEVRFLARGISREGSPFLDPTLAAGHPTTGGPGVSSGLAPGISSGTGLREVGVLDPRLAGHTTTGGGSAEAGVVPSLGISSGAQTLDSRISFGDKLWDPRISSGSILDPCSWDNLRPV